MLALAVSLQVKPGHRDAFLAAITENAKRSFTDEPGCVQFDVVVDAADDHHFLFYELYTDQAAFEAHRAAPHFTAWRQAAAEHLVPGSQVNTFADLLSTTPSVADPGNESTDMTETAITTLDPRTGEVLAEYPAFDDARIESAIAGAHAAAASWAATPLAKRLELLRALAETLRAGRDEYAALMTAEMGKPITEAAGEVEKSAVTADYYVAHAAASSPTDTCRSTACEPGSATSRSGWSTRSCRGTSRSGRSCASPSPPSRPATPSCSSTPRTSPAAPSRSSSWSSGPGSRRAC